MLAPTSTRSWNGAAPSLTVQEVQCNRELMKFEAARRIHVLADAVVVALTTSRRSSAASARAIRSAILRPLGADPFVSGVGGTAPGIVPQGGRSARRGFCWLAGVSQSEVGNLSASRGGGSACTATLCRRTTSIIDGCTGGRHDVARVYSLSVGVGQVAIPVRA